MRRDIYDIKAANAAAGNYFFSEGAMRFFRSRVHEEVYGSGFFVTSESPPDGRRCYTVRFCQADGSITTVGSFMAYASRNGAHAAAARFAAMDAAGQPVYNDLGRPVNEAVAA